MCASHCIDFCNVDSEGLRKQALEGVKLGFTGKQVIHPSQVPIVQEAFSPSKEKIEWAKDLIKEFKQHTETGKGVFNFRQVAKQKQTISSSNSQCVFYSKENILLSNQFYFYV